MATQPLTLLTEEEYLRIERAALFKSEFVDGHMYAMAGGSPTHSRLAVNATVHLGAQLLESSCHLHSSDMRVRTPRGAQMYPDISGVCGEDQLHPGTNDILVNPVLVIEVSSPSTAVYDRGAKFELYRQIPTLREYLVIHQASIFAEHRRKNPDGTWVVLEYRGPAARIPLPAIGCELQLGSIYKGVLNDSE